MEKEKQTVHVNRPNLLSDTSTSKFDAAQAFVGQPMWARHYSLQYVQVFLFLSLSCGLV